MYGRKLSLFSRSSGSSSIFRQKPNYPRQSLSRQASQRRSLEKQREAERKRQARAREAKRRAEEEKRRQERERRANRARQKQEEVREMDRRHQQLRNREIKQREMEESEARERRRMMDHQKDRGAKLETLKKEALQFALNFCTKLKNISSLKDVLELEAMAIRRELKVTQRLKKELQPEEDYDYREEGLVGPPSPPRQDTRRGAEKPPSLNPHNLHLHDDQVRRKKGNSEAFEDTRLKAASIVSLIKGNTTGKAGGSIHTFLSDDTGWILEQGELPLHNSNVLARDHEPPSPIRSQSHVASFSKPRLEPDDSQIEVYNPLTERDSIGSDELSVLKDRLSIC